MTPLVWVLARLIRRLPSQGSASGNDGNIGNDGNGVEVVYLEGFFRSSMPKLRASLRANDHANGPDGRSIPGSIPGSIAIARLDGDMFESTMDILFHVFEVSL